MTGMDSELRLRLDAIAKRIANARNQASEGGAVDLHDLTGEVQAVCEALRLAPVQFDRKAVAGEIEEILSNLTHLERELTGRENAHSQKVDG